MSQIEIVIPDEMQKKYNHSLKVREIGQGDIVGAEESIKTIESIGIEKKRQEGMKDEKDAIKGIILVGQQGAGKTATIDQLTYVTDNTNNPAIVIELSLEALGELPENIVISRIKTLLADMTRLREETKNRNIGKQFQLYLFIDEFHKLYFYGSTGKTSSAFEALKDSTGRSEFPIIGATTEQEYRDYIAINLPFARRFTNIFIQEPLPEVTKTILRTKLNKWKKNYTYLPDVKDNVLEEIIEYSDYYITEQANPGKSIMILGSANNIIQAEFARNGEKLNIDHHLIADVFKTTGSAIDFDTSSEDVEREMAGIKGQPLAKKRIMDVVNSTLYTIRDRRRPYMTIFGVGTTGTGKTETAKALARAFYGSDENMVVINGGDYSAPTDALRVQNLIGDQMVTNKMKLILLDEIEKFHSNVRDGLMGVIDEGVAKSSNGIPYSIRSTIVMATSNLGADVFTDIQNQVDLPNLNLPDNPPEFDPELEEKIENLPNTPIGLNETLLKEISIRNDFKKLEEQWHQNQASVISALQNGDPHKNNGIKPEFLERFKIFIPYMPLTKKAIASIARSQLDNFQKKIRTDLGITIQLGARKSNKDWLTKIGKCKYDNVDSVSVMVAEDIIGAEAKTSGARSISRYIEGTIQPQVGNYVAYLKKKNKSIDGYFRLQTNGRASFEDPVLGFRPNVKLTYIKTQ